MYLRMSTLYLFSEMELPWETWVPPPPPPGFGLPPRDHLEPPPGFADRELALSPIVMEMSMDHIDIPPRSPTPPPQADERAETPMPMEMDDFDDSILDYPPPPRPDALTESSIADPEPLDITADANIDRTYQIVTGTSTRGKDKAYDSVGYSYTIKRRTAKSTTWRCSYRSSKINCPATVREVGGDWISGAREHVHQPTPGACVAASIATIAKDTAKENPFQSAQEIATQLVHENVPPTMACPALPSLDRIAANANHHRRLTRPKHPKDLDFDIVDGQFPDSYLRSDIRVGDARHLVFATDNQMSLLETAKTWYVDATFQVVRRPFTQLLTVNAFVRQGTATKQLPILMCVNNQLTDIPLTSAN